MTKSLIGCALILLCASAISCDTLRDADIKPGAAWLYFVDDDRPDTWLDISLYLDRELIVQTNLPLKKIEASCVGITYPIKSYCAEGTRSFENLNATINHIDRDGIGIDFYRLSGSFHDSTNRFDSVRERIMIPYEVFSRGKVNRVSYIARWRK